MEALQTDVMRFMAILGLCLAAIFSLVQSPDYHPSVEAPPAVKGISAEPVPREHREQVVRPQDKPAIAEAPKPRSQPETVVEQRLSPPKQAAADTPPQQEQSGFVLEFDSAASLAALVGDGSVTLVVVAGEGHWQWTSDGNLTEATTLSGFYAMEEGTVPAQYRRAAATQLGAGKRGWGVVLPTAITAQIDSLVTRHQGGVLAISANGTVSREALP